MMGEIKKKSLLEQLAIQVLKGDEAAAYALVDYLQEIRDGGLEPPREIVNTHVMDGTTLYFTEEFKALCKLLGIRHELPTLSLTITIPHDGPVQIDHAYQGRTRTDQ